MLSAFTNCLKIPELRQRIFTMLSLLFIARIGANIPLPGVNPEPLKAFLADQTGGAGGLLGVYDMFTGGALTNGAVFALGIMPYISASIIFQLMGAVFPALARLQQEGEAGRQKISQYTRYATIAICIVQAVLLVLSLQRNPGALVFGYDIAQYGPIVVTDSAWFLVQSTIFLTAGTVLLMWIGEQITKLGIGNGISILITIGIISSMPAAVVATYEMFTGPVGTERFGIGQGILLAGLLLIVTAGLVAVIQVVRKIPVHYAKRVVGRKVYGGQSSFMPLKVNYSGVMPVIFGSALLAFPQQILSSLGGALHQDWLIELGNVLVRGSVTYYIVFGLMILFFSYFWVSVMFKPIQIADDLKKYGGYVPGVRPGQPTAKFLDFVMTRLTLAGSIFLTLIAVFPDVLLFAYRIPNSVAAFFGGTGMLIAVGVALDTMKQIETHLLQRHYDGFLKRGRIRGRSQAKGAGGAIALAGATEMKNVGKLYLTVTLIFAVGVAAWALKIATNSN